MNKFNRKFTMTKALYILLWICFAVSCITIIAGTMCSLIDNDYHPSGLLYHGCVWDYIEAAAFLLLALSFKKEV